jgi:hypothetical protein
MGDIPSKDSMVSQLITFPAPGASSKIKPEETFDIKVAVKNLAAGSFTNPDNT